MSPDPGRPQRTALSRVLGDRARREGRRGVALALATGLAVPLGAGTALAAVVPVTPPQSIEVFPGVDMVGAAGFEGPFTIEVWRDGVKIGTTGAPVESALLEINHDGPPCWSGVTPNIVSGDEIRVITEDGADPVGQFMTVANTSANPAELVALDADGVKNDVVMKGRARTLDGTAPLPLANMEAEIVQPAWRDNGWRSRALGAVPGVPMPDATTPFPDGGDGVLAYDPVGAGNEDGTRWTATWKNMPEPHGSLALDGEQVIVSWERNDPATEEGVGLTLMSAHDESGPGTGCPPAASDAVTGTVPANVNIAARNAGGDFVISGTSYNASAVRVTVDDADAVATDAVTVDAVVNNAASLAETDAPVAPVQQTWRATVPMADVAAGGLEDGELTVTGVYDRVVETAEQRTTTEPVFNEDGSPQLEEARNADNTAVPADDPSLYRDADDQLVPAMDNSVDPPVQVTDASGTPVYMRQVTEEVTRTVYVHTARPIGGAAHTLLKDLVAPAAPTAFPPGGTYYASQSVSIDAADEFNETVRYRVGNPAPEPTTASPLVSGQLSVTASQQIRAASWDRAGNRGPTLVADYDIRTPSVSSAPTGVSAVAGDASATVRWTPPADNGGSAINNYVIRVFQGGTHQAALLQETGDGTVTEWLVTGLTNGLAYQFSVQAENSTGASLQSARSVAVTPQAAVTAPGAPAIGTATAGNASATVRWTAPTSNGGSAITGYLVQPYNATTGAAVGAARSAGATASSLNVTGLTNGTAYNFDVRAVNAVGTSPASAKSNTVTPIAGDTVAPTVTGRSPAVNATRVGLAANTTATFSEAVTGLSTTSFVLRNPAGTVVPAAVTYNATSRVATLNPSANLAADTRYTASLTNAVTDAAGNRLAPLSWTFLTGPGPTVTAISPASGATGVARNANVTATFSEPVTAATVNTTTVNLRPAAGGANIAAVVSYNATTRVATLNPNAALAASTRYTVRVTTGVTDLAGNPATARSWSFTTGTAL